MIEGLLTVKDVAEHLGIRQHGVLAPIKSSELRAVNVSLKPGGRPRWRIQESDLDSFHRTRTHQAAPPRRRRRKTKNIKQYS